MLADPKSQALVDNFVGQWLQLRNLKNKQPNSHEFPDFDDNLRARARRPRPSCSSRSIMREDRSVLDLMTADYTFVNERLAQALRHPERLRQPLPPRDAAGRRPARAARQGRRS